MHKPPSRVPGFLQTLPMFREMHVDQLRRIAIDSAEVDAPRGTRIFSRGDVCTGLHLVVFGQIKLALDTPHGDERVVDLVGAGRSLGPGPLFGDRPHNLTADALQDSKLVHIPKASVHAELERNHGFARCIINDLTQREEQLVNDIENCTLRSGKQRVSWYLLSQLGETQQQSNASITLPSTKGVVASHMNLTHEHFSRILHELAVAGLIIMNGRQIDIPDVTRLQSLSGA